MSGVSFHQSFPTLPCTMTVPSVSRNGTPAPSGGWFLSDVIVCACETLQNASISVTAARNSFFVKTDLRLKITVNVNVRNRFARLGFDWGVRRSARRSTLNSLSGATARRHEHGKQSSQILLHRATRCQSI